MYKNNREQTQCYNGTIANVKSELILEDNTVYGLCTLTLKVKNVKQNLI